MFVFLSRGPVEPATFRLVGWCQSYVRGLAAEMAVTAPLVGGMTGTELASHAPSPAE